MAEELKIKISAEGSGQVKQELSKTQQAIGAFKSGISSIGKAVGSFAKATGVAMAAGGAAIASLATSAVKAYADYEQLSGGVEKLFGAEASQTLMSYAQNAYKTAGMSANQYMELSTSFAASLIQSYGGDTAKAVDMTDTAMRAISDNFNTFGGDIHSVQAAFQGFAKQNYTMLDNLKLGYGGTKSEMERLISDANEYAKSMGMAGDLTIDSFGDIVEAIDLVQQKQGIAGTTAKEAATTIAGSVGMMKAAWQNLLVAFADGNADVGAAFDALVSSAETAFYNILPVAEQALTGIGSVVENLAPVLGAKFPELITNVLPSMLGAITGLIDSLATSLPAMIGPIISAITAALPSIISAGIQLFAGLATALIASIPQIIAALPQIWSALKAGFAEAWPMLQEAGIQLMNMVAEGIQAAGDWVAGKAQAIWDSIKTAASNTWNAIKSATSATWGNITSAISSAWSNIKSGVSAGVNAVKSTVSSVFGAISGTVSGIWNGIKSTISSTMDGIKAKITSAVNTIKNVFNFSWKLPSLKLPHFTVSGSFSLNPPSVPSFGISWYAKGGVFDMPTLFGYGKGKIGGLGENGAEAVVPLENNTQWLDRIAERLSEKISTNPIVMEVDGKVFGQIACDSINGLTRQTGRLNINVI